MIHMKHFIKIMSDSINEITILFIIKDGHKIIIDHYPQLNKLGKWIPSNDSTILRLRTRLGKLTIIKEFSKITGLNKNRFKAEEISSIDVW